VLNARDVSWIRSEERGQDTDFEGAQEWSQLGFRIHVLMTGQHGLYHRERGQEDFLVIAGECLLVIEGEERRLKAWDFVHCPPWTSHVFVGGGEGPCVIVMTGSRAGGFEAVYPVNEVAAKHGASVLEETSKRPRPTPASDRRSARRTVRAGCRDVHPVAWGHTHSSGMSPKRACDPQLRQDRAMRVTCASEGGFRQWAS
jgi:quercetin dioxygenase-like cupin family protein